VTAVFKSRRNRFHRSHRFSLGTPARPFLAPGGTRPVLSTASLSLPPVVPAVLPCRRRSSASVPRPPRRELVARGIAAQPGRAPASYRGALRRSASFIPPLVGAAAGASVPLGLPRWPPSPFELRPPGPPVDEATAKTWWPEASRRRKRSCPKRRRCKQGTADCQQCGLRPGDFLSHGPNISLEPNKKSQSPPRAPALFREDN